MKTYLLAVLFILVSFGTQAQIIFEKGYFIDNKGQRTECLIRNLVWLNNPSKIEYKSETSQGSTTLSIDDLKEFGIGQTTKYVRYTVDVDTSGVLINSLSRRRAPEFKKETLLLQVLIEGEANLYMFRRESILRFFFQMKDSSQVEQLVYKKFFVNEAQLGVNETFKMQLINNLKCPTLARAELERLNYVEDDLLRCFKKFNACLGQTTNYQKTRTKGAINLNLKPGLALVTYAIESTTSLAFPSVKFNPNLGFRLGMEAEFILPFNKNKWAILLEPAFHFFSTQATAPQGRAVMRYASLEFPVGVRYSFFLTANTKLFVNTHLLLDQPLNYKIEVGTAKLSPRRGLSLMGGGGISHKNKSLELRYSNRDFLGEYIFLLSDYRAITLILGIKLR
jgi:hypothetical protein